MLDHVHCITLQMRRNPAKYGMPGNLNSDAAFDDAAERRPVLFTLTQLATHGLVNHFLPFVQACYAMYCTCVVCACIDIIQWCTRSVCMLHGWLGLCTCVPV